MSMLINLLPDIRQAKLREQRRRQMAVGISVLVWAISGGTILVLFLFSASQKVQIKFHDDSIAKTTNQLRSVAGLTDALTASQHLGSLSMLYSNRMLFTKFMGAYMASDPKDVTLGALSVDESNTMIASGTSKTFASLAKLQRALEESNVSVGTGAAATNMPYFSSVKVQSAVATTGKGVVFTLNATVSAEVLHGK